jgi:hypothetical protein
MPNKMPVLLNLSTSNICTQLKLEKNVYRISFSIYNVFSEYRLCPVTVLLVLLPVRKKGNVATQRAKSRKPAKHCAEWCRDWKFEALA